MDEFVAFAEGMGFQVDQVSEYYLEIKFPTVQARKETSKAWRQITFYDTLNEKQVLIPLSSQRL